MKRKISVLLLITMLLGTVLFSCNNNSVDTPVDDTTVEDTTVEAVEDTTAEDTTVEDTTEEETTVEETTAEETTEEETTAEETTAEETTEEETTAEETTAEETTEEETTAEETTAEETTEEETTAEETTAEETTEEVTTEEETTEEETTEEVTTEEETTEEVTTEEETEEETTEEVTTEEEEEELPTVLPTYTGNLNPRIINTVYPTKDVIIAEIDVVADGYGVDPTGVNDSTAGIQKAIDDVYKNGGGTVFLPAGTYRVTKTIEIRPYTALHGDWCDPDLKKGYGTVILADVPSVDSRTTGLFELGCASGVVGLTVYYPNQSADNVLPYPFTFYIDGAPNADFIAAFNDYDYEHIYMVPTIRNTTIINGYRGIGANCNGWQKYPHEELNIENFHGTFLLNACELYNSSDVNTTDGVYVSTKYWLEASESYMTKPKASSLNSYVKGNVTALILADLEWSQFSNIHIDGCKVGIYVVPLQYNNGGEPKPSYLAQFNACFYDLFITNCDKGLVLDSHDERWGTVIASGQIDGGIYNNSPGYVKLTGVKVNGQTSGQVIVEGDESALYDIDYDKYYKKPVSKLYIASFSNNNDIGKELQAVINEAGKTGGVVYIPAGIYEIYDPVVVPAGVEIRGATSVATRGHTGASMGTIILCGYGDQKGKGIDDQALITLNGANSGVNGLMLIYPYNTPGSNADTTFTIRGKAKGVYVVNSFIAASAYGIDFRGCDDHYIKNVVTYCYYNTYLVGGRNGAIIGCLQNPTALLRTVIPGRVSYIGRAKFASLLVETISKKMSQFIIVEGGQNQLVYNTFAYGPMHLVVNNNSTGTCVINLGADQVGGTGVGNGTAMLVMNGGSMKVINPKRVFGHSFDHISGTLSIYNRTTIWEDGEDVYIETK